MRILTVGNSFSGDATRFLGSLAEAANKTLVLNTVSVGGASMALHWEKAEQYERDTHGERGLYPSGRSLRQELLAVPWDAVTIQQTSRQSHDITTYRPYAARLKEYINTLAPQADLLLHETWAYRKDDVWFADTPSAIPQEEPTTQKEMYEQLRQSYDVIATELGVRVIPVGDAFFRADTDPVWGFKLEADFDPKRAMYPDLPRQTHSLHVGWYWKIVPGETPVLQKDGHHASAAGQYLGACVFYEVLFGESSEGNPFIPEGIDAEYAHFLQNTAHNAVTARQKRVSHHK